MPPATLVVQALVQFVTAASFAYVGGTIRSRHASTPDGEVAARAFVGWWWGMAAYLTLLGVVALLGWAGVTYVPVYLAARVFGVPMLALAAWGIMTYVLFLYTGRPGIATWTAAYALLLALAFWFETFRDSTGTISVGAWSAGLGAPKDPRLLNAVYAMFAVPLLLSTIAYLSLLARVREPAQRYRIGLVSGSILAWVAGGYAGSSSGDPLAQFLSVTILGLGAAFTVLLAYKPPRRVQAWLDKRAELATERRSEDGRSRLAIA